VTESYNITTLLNGRNFQRIVKMGKKPLENRVENNSHKKEKCETFFFFCFFFFSFRISVSEERKKKRTSMRFPYITIFKSIPKQNIIPTHLYSSLKPELSSPILPSQTFFSFSKQPTLNFFPIFYPYNP